MMKNIYFVKEKRTKLEKAELTLRLEGIYSEEFGGILYVPIDEDRTIGIHPAEIEHLAEEWDDLPFEYVSFPNDEYTDVVECSYADSRKVFRDIRHFNRNK